MSLPFHRSELYFVIKHTLRFLLLYVFILTRRRFLYNQFQTLSFLKPQIFQAKAANQFKGTKFRLISTSLQIVLNSTGPNLNFFHPTLTFFVSLFFFSLLLQTCILVKISFRISSYFDHFILVTHIFCVTTTTKK